MKHASRRGRVLGAALAVATMLAVGSIALPDAHADDADAALQQARTATVSEDFSGIVQIEWLQDGTWQVARLPVKGTGGTVRVGSGAHKAEAADDDRWVSGVSGWEAGWTLPITGDVPAPSKHWSLALLKGPLVAGRTTNVVVATDPQTHEPRLKVYVDRDTGVMLRREVLDQRGHSVRSVGFVEVKKLGGSRSAAPKNPKAKDAAPAKLVNVPKGYDAPARIGARYALVGRYLRDDGAVQLYYSDGLFGISLFEQRGSLDWNGLPRGGGGVTIGDDRARDYEVAGGTVLVWEHGDLTLTAVSDATVRDLQTFAVAFGHQSGGDGGVLDDVADFVLGPFGFR